VTGYWVRRNGTVVNSVLASSPYTDTSASAGTTYTYTVVAHDLAGNESVPSAASPPVTTPNALSVSVNSNSWSWMRLGAGAANVSPSTIIVTASGGSGGYTYLWERVTAGFPGDDTHINVSSPTGSATFFTRSGIPTNTNVTYTAHFRCRVTDSSSAIVYTPTITVTFTQNSFE
jgi:hypothetical protein